MGRPVDDSAQRATLLVPSGLLAPIWRSRVFMFVPIGALLNVPAVPCAAAPAAGVW